MHQEELRENLHNSKQVIENLTSAFWWKDLNFNYAWANQSCINHLKLKCRQNIFELDDYEMPWDCYADDYIEKDKIVIEQEKPLAIVHPILLGNKLHTSIITYKSPYFNKYGKVIGPVLGLLP